MVVWVISFTWYVEFVYYNDNMFDIFMPNLTSLVHFVKAKTLIFIPNCTYFVIL